MAASDELLSQADALDAQAAGLPEEDQRAAALRRQAADLRVEALGQRPYPVLICSACFRMTGWLGAEGACATDTRRSATSNDWSVGDRRARPVAQPATLLRRMRRGLGVSTSRDRAKEWMTKVDPDATGPVAPEEGWGIEWPVKAELPAPEGPDLIVTFDVQSYRFEDGSWRECDVTPGGKPRRLVPREFAASLAIDALAEAWNDFEAEVAAHNARVWATERARRDGTDQINRERSAAYESERGTSEILG